MPKCGAFYTAGIGGIGLGRQRSPAREQVARILPSVTVGSVPVQADGASEFVGGAFEREGRKRPSQ